MPWINARPPGSEVSRVDEPYTVGEHETGYVLPRGLALEEGPSSVVVKRASDSSVLTEVAGTPASGEYRVLYDPDQPMGGAIEFNVAEAGVAVLLSYEDRGSLLWAHDLPPLDGILAFLPTAPADADLGLSQGTFWIDEAADEVRVRIRRSDGSYVSGSFTVTPDILTVVSDTFTRANSTTTLGSAETGQAWTAWAGTWGISSNKAYRVSGPVDNFAALDSGLVDGTFQILATSDNYVDRNVGLVFRGIDASNFLLVDLLNGQVRLLKKVSGTYSTVSSVAQTLTNSQEYEVRAVADGTSVDVYVDDVLKIQYTLTGSDATLFTGSGATYAGMRVGVNSGDGSLVRFDDLEVTT